MSSQADTGTSTQCSEEVPEESQVAPEGTGTRRCLVDPETPGHSSKRNKGNPTEMALLEKASVKLVEDSSYVILKSNLICS